MGIGTVWRMTTSFAVVQSAVADKDRVFTLFFANKVRNAWALFNTLSSLHFAEVLMLAREVFL